MSARVPVYVKVTKVHTEVVRIYAVTTEEAENEARCLPGVLDVVESSYEEPEDRDGETPGIYRTEVTAEETKGESFDVMPVIPPPSSASSTTPPGA